MTEKIKELIIGGKAKLIGAAVQEALDAGCNAAALLGTMISAMDVVGERFKNGEIFVPEMLIAAKAMKMGVEVLKPHLATGAFVRTASSKNTDRWPCGSNDSRRDG